MSLSHFQAFTTTTISHMRKWHKVRLKKSFSSSTELKGRRWNLSEEEWKRSESPVQQNQKLVQEVAVDSEGQIVRDCTKFIYAAMKNTLSKS